MKLEFLSAENIEKALDFAEMSHLDSAWKDYSFKREILKKNLERMIGKPNYFTCICRQDDKFIGYWFATLTTFLFSDVLLGSENGIYVLPEYRGGRAAFLMWGAFKSWCDEKNVEPMAEVQFGNNGDNQKAYDFFKKLGMIECGRIFRGGKHGLPRSTGG